uniref:ABC-type glutathione-S-conjugate transporter n=1 Tax=Caenorhabditis tropicalis TaxID=1561998 RepID=A0A1I7UPW2_9PELO
MLPLVRELVCGSDSELFEPGWKNRSTLPHVTNCGQHTDFSTIPTIFLVIFSPVLVYALYHTHNAQIRCFSPVSLRIVVGCLLVVDLFFTVIYDLHLFFTDSATFDNVHFYGDLVQFAGICLALVLTIACKNKGIITSGVITLYWLLVVLCGIPEFRYYLSGYIYMEHHVDHVRATLYTIAYMFSVAELFLCCFADIPSKIHKSRKSCPEHSSSFINQLTFQWFTGLAILGNKKSLETEDLWDLNERDRAENIIPSFMANLKPGMEEYRRRVKKNPEDATPKNYPSVFRPLLKTYKFTLLAGACYKLSFDMLQFLAPQLLKQLISFIEDKSQPVWIGVSIVCFMFLASFLQSMLLHQYYHEMYRLGMHVRSVLTSAVYTKALNLSNEARKGKTTGAIVNLMSVDIQKIQDIVPIIMLFWSAPLQIFLSIFFLYKILGVAVFAGFVALIMVIPINGIIAGKMRACHMEQMKYKDERIKMMSEILNGMKVLKLYSWEKSMEKMVLEIREKELMVLKRLSYLNAGIVFSWICAPFLVSVISFVVYVLLDPENNVLTPEITFVALSLFDILRMPLALLAMVYGEAVQCAVSNSRLKEFFAADEIAPQQAITLGKSDSALKVENGSFSWSSDEDHTLHDISLNIQKGQLVAIVGRVGSGKSSLLHAILGEMNKVSGSVQINGTVAYVPQQAWIQNMSLKNNILFNKPFDLNHYNEVVTNCALKEDLANLPAGDSTEIGEKGINLSGGQKQRVSLARAVYQNPDIVLFDDPLSAVDSHVGKHIFENVISSLTGCLGTKTRILITHGLTYLKNCDKVVVLKDGTISEMGTYQQLINNNGAFAEFLEEFLLEEAKHRGRVASIGDQKNVSKKVSLSDGEVDEILRDLGQVSPGILQRLESHLSQESEREEKSARDFRLEFSRENSRKSVLHSPISKHEETEALLGAITEEEDQGKEKTQLIEKEALETGHVKFEVYLAYFRAISIPITLLFFFAYVGSSTLGVLSNFYLARLSDNAKNMADSGNSSSTDIRTQLAIYASLGIGQSAVVCVASIILALGMVRASRILHAGLLGNIMRSPMAFFDVTPIGRILNRLGKDIEAVDRTLPDVIRHMVMTIFNVVSTLVVIVWATPWAGLAFAILSVIYFFVLRFYISTSRQLKRLESASRSPIYSHFQESIQGASSIRAYGVVEKFIKQSQQRVDEHLVAHYPSMVANRWLAVRLELVGNLIVLSAAGMAVYFRDSPGLSAGLVGLSVSYALNITQTLNWAVRMTSEMETNIVSVERIKEYSVTPTEGNDSIRLASKSWPERGEISIKNFSVRYRPGLELVLHGVTAHVEPSEKVGIVGRTGAGKSSLTLALFRIIEADGGCIEIDGHNIADLQLEQLRSRLTIVPQDPVLFSGSMRMNLDPFDAYSDAQVWEALKNAHLESFVRSLQDGLAHHISEGGENLSVGQRQLICLARALLRKTKVLVLDEAAAAVDVETDSLIQKTIREQFKECTVLTIAHRLNTVMDSDRLLVLDKGRVAEFDSPKQLLSNPDGIFYSMAKDANVV